MKKVPLFLIPTALVFILGCSSNPVSPDRDILRMSSDTMPFQMATFLACPEYGNPRLVPTNVPLGQLIPPEHFSLFASYALAALDVYFEQNDWDDWLAGDSTPERTILYEQNDWDDWLAGDKAPERTMLYEPNDWDDWLIGKQIAPSATIRIAHNEITPIAPEKISLLIDPENLYEPNDWDDWLLKHEPADWDNWLHEQTIDNVATLND